MLITKYRLKSIKNDFPFPIKDEEERCKLSEFYFVSSSDHISNMISPCRLAETCVATGYRLGDQELSRAVYTRLVDTREEELCVHPGGNFIIQRLLDNIGDQAEFLELAERLGALLETVLASGCSGVVLSLVSNKHQQSHFTNFSFSR